MGPDTPDDPSITRTEPTPARPPAPHKRPFGVFVSYRRDDSAGHAGRLYDKLAERFSDRRVFIDVNAIKPGMDFRTAIEQALEGSSVFLAIIGKRWLDATAADGTRRLDEPTDLVRLEIAAALRQGLDVIPVLVQRTSMPSAAQLPDEIQALKFRHAIELDDTSWDEDVERLIHAIQGGGGRRRPRWPTWVLASVAALGVIAVVGAGAWLLASRSSQPQPSASATPSADATSSAAASVVTAPPSAAGSGAAPSFQTVVFRDDLKGPVPGLVAGTTRSCSTDVSDGLTITAQGVGHLCDVSLAPVDPALVSLQDVSVEVDIAFQAFTASTSEFGPGDSAIICRLVGSAATGNYYVASLSPSGYWDVNRYDKGVQERIDSGNDPDLAMTPGTTRHLGLKCSGPAGGTTTISLSVDRQVVSAVLDPSGLGPGSVALAATSYETPKVTVTFHDLVIRGP